ncbi:hypothetical protein SBA_ch1_25310 [Sphingomonas bisphenolicum]|uniref:Uncharacterized protein n=1 Tax=Sphingomonas bisphenolicum TaxID=296544 RepID=A0ABN5WDF0_9SPHN|nr:hypothetical protein SBA_ch1_25310 [Sphingomonas bisphenolicum]
MTRTFIIKDIDRNHRPFADSGGQGGLIGQAEILAKPEEKGIGHAGAMRPSAAGSKRPLGHIAFAVPSIDPAIASPQIDRWMIRPMDAEPRPAYSGSRVV